MRLQTAAICDDFESVPRHGFTIKGVTSRMIVDATYDGPGDTPDASIPIKKKLVLILVDGQAGTHQLLLTVQDSERDIPIATNRVPFDWPDNKPTYLL
ncbi:MAG: hypothetical protein IIC50_20145, partial [Planctomycetes bacterium]|nr:hypothetical protein [Planctomycetota bacterium]